MTTAQPGMRLIRPADYRRMPWKNGGGETIEIAVFPQGASLAAFDWRISMARVDGNGPFSTFPGMDRTLAILDGEGIVLQVGDAAPVVIAGSTAPYRFSADVPAFAELIAGPVLDLNVMSRRGAIAHAVERLDLTQATEIAAGALAVLFCTRGSVRATTWSGEADVAEGDTLLVSGSAGRFDLVPRGSATLFRVDITTA